MPESTVDAADGAVKSGPLNEDLNKILKRLGYPDIHDNSKPSALIEKAILACTKRLKKLWEMLPARKEKPKDAKQAEEEAKEEAISASDLQEKPYS